MIVASAILHDGIIFTGVRHSEIIKDLVRLGYSTPIPNHEQGFVKTGGYFLFRELAKDYAKLKGQIPSDFNKVLTSEDLW